MGRPRKYNTPEELKEAKRQATARWRAKIDAENGVEPKPEVIKEHEDLYPGDTVENYPPEKQPRRTNWERLLTVQDPKPPAVSTFARDIITENTKIHQGDDPRYKDPDNHWGTFGGIDVWLDEDDKKKQWRV